MIRSLPLAVLTLRREPFDQPTSILLQRVSQAIVQTIFLALPKLDHFGPDTIAAPMRRARDIVGELPTKFFESLFKHGAALDRLTLIGCPGADLAAQRPRMEILI